MGSRLRDFLFLLALASLSFGQVQISVFSPPNVSANSLIAMNVELANTGFVDRTQVRAFLNSLDPNVKVSRGYEYVGSLGRDSAQNVSFAFIFGNRSGTYPMQVLVYDSRDSYARNFSVSSSFGVDLGSGGDKAGDDVFLAYGRVGALGSMFDGMARDSAECRVDGLAEANRSYSLARENLALAQRHFANRSYSDASRSAKLAVELADKASSEGGAVLDSQRSCLEARRLALLERERENFHRNISQYKRSLSSLHTLLGFFEAQGANVTVERGVERNIAVNVEQMEEAAGAEGGMGRAVGLAGNTEMLFAASPQLLYGRLGLIERGIGDAEYGIARFYLGFDEAKKLPLVAGPQLAKLSAGAGAASSELEKARASLKTARAYVSYRDFLFFAAAGVDHLGQADKALRDANVQLEDLVEFSSYKARVGEAFLAGAMFLLALGAAAYLILQKKEKWKLVESARGFHYKKRP